MSPYRQPADKDSTEPNEFGFIPKLIKGWKHLRSTKIEFSRWKNNEHIPIERDVNKQITKGNFLRSAKKIILTQENDLELLQLRSNFIRYYSPFNPIELEKPFCFLDLYFQKELEFINRTVGLPVEMSISEYHTHCTNRDLLDSDSSFYVKLVSERFSRIKKRFLLKNIEYEAKFILFYFYDSFEKSPKRLEEFSKDGFFDFIE